MCRSVVGLFLLVTWASTSFAQNVTVTHNVNLRPEQSSAVKAIRLLTPSEPPMTLVKPFVQDGYYHVCTTMGEDGYVYSRNVHVSAGAPTGGSPPRLHREPEARRRRQQTRSRSGLVYPARPAWLAAATGGGSMCTTPRA
jgi:hypothetical protein